MNPLSPRSFPLRLLPVLLPGLAAAYSLSGKVVCKGTNVPLAGAQVRVSGHPSVPAATTDDQGAFLLTDQAARIADRPAWGIAWREGVLTARVGESGTLRLDVFDAAGRLLVSREIAPSDGTARCPLPAASRGGLRFLRLRQGTRSGTWKWLDPGGASHGAFTPVAGRALAAADTLVVTKSGMDTLRQILPEGAGEAVGSLEQPLAPAARAQGRMRYIPGGASCWGTRTSPIRARGSGARSRRSGSTP